MFAKKYGTLVRHAFFVMVRMRYVGSLFEERFKRTKRTVYWYGTFLCTV